MHGFTMRILPASETPHTKSLKPLIVVCASAQKHLAATTASPALTSSPTATG